MPSAIGAVELDGCYHSPFHLEIVRQPILYSQMLKLRLTVPSLIAKFKTWQRTVAIQFRYYFMCDSILLTLLPTGFSSML